ncbi:UDP-N-acetylglucosamine--N-acetylmuramyl-(pentapeptide) pyrophosphoryl-undecaprenol N-acetylglucosamine transferase [Streptomyces spectabilis]|uniref:UDP-N-acetylglucosamine--N-acetylmuramyl- (pentapeptide) pyrophosphoryl-undecaprenol N-acetylglucosamine transferase n=1 Tax=Streptomyces spectabilis TaxID=68270 RepID=UPI0033FEC852
MTVDEFAPTLASLNRPFRLIVTGGGTGGHTYPALTAIRTLEARLGALGTGLEALWVGTEQGLEARVAPAEKIRFMTVPTGKIRRSSNPLAMINRENIRDMGRVVKGVPEARKIVSRFEADVVLSTGGYVSVPVGLAAKATNTPLVVHEQTVRLGLANRALARFATTIAVSSESTLPLLKDGGAKAVVTGNPVRPAVLTGQPDKAVAALALPGYTPALPTVYITGGAQGSAQINAMIRDILPWLLSAANVVHQCGATSLETSRQHADTLPPGLRARYWLSDFVGPELPDVLALADIVIARSGAGTIAELTALGKPSILIPLATSAGNEQEHNALYLQQAGAATALTKDHATAPELQHALEPILTRPEQRQNMARSAAGLGRPDAAHRLVDVLLKAGLRTTRP